MDEAGLSGTYWSFPKIFQTSLVPNPKYLVRYKPCVCDSMVVNYTPSGQNAFYRASKDTDNLNSPEGIDLSMHFIEYEYWKAGDFKDTNDPQDVEGQIFCLHLLGNINYGTSRRI